MYKCFLLIAPLTVIFFSFGLLSNENHSQIARKEEWKRKKKIQKHEIGNSKSYLSLYTPPNAKWWQTLDRELAFVDHQEFCKVILGKAAKKRTKS